MQPFGPEYSAVYDSIYATKQYSQECDLIDRLVQSYTDRRVGRILDFGCGTGNHAIEMAQRGYEVWGVDRSRNMLDHAEMKSSTLPRHCRPVFVCGDIRDTELPHGFDLVLMMFAVLGYQRENEDVLAVLTNAYRHLSPGGLLVFDCWYGPAVLCQRPSHRDQMFPTRDGQIRRTATADIDISQQLCSVHYQLSKEDRRRKVTQAEENHVMRFFFPSEMDQFLNYAGFDPVRYGAFPEFALEPDETSWNFCVVARRRAAVSIEHSLPNRKARMAGTQKSYA